MFSILQSEGSRKNEQCEGFGYNASIDYLSTNDDLPGFATHQTVMFKPLSGFFSQMKFLPLKYCPIEIELELVSDPNEPIVSVVVGTEFTAENTSYK